MSISLSLVIARAEVHSSGAAADLHTRRQYALSAREKSNVDFSVQPLLWLGLELNLQPATPLRVGRWLPICIPIRHVAEMRDATAISENFSPAGAA